MHREEKYARTKIWDFISERMFLCVKNKTALSGSCFFVCFFAVSSPGASGRRFAVCGRYRDQQRRCVGGLTPEEARGTDPRDFYAGEYSGFLS